MTTKSAADEAYEGIKQRILDGEYYPSQRLVEANLASTLGVSRHNVRLALDRLSSDGLVRLEPNRGATVATLTLEEALDILVARESLEANVARLAAQHITASQLEQLREHVSTMRAALAEHAYDRYSETNKAFHAVIYEASGNRTIPELIGFLRLRLTRLQLRTILIPGRDKESLDEHAAILEALEARDSDLADDAIRSHMRNLRAAIDRAWSLVRL